jgi:hypothetical protein
MWSSRFMLGSDQKSSCDRCSMVVTIRLYLVASPIENTKNGVLLAIANLDDVHDRRITDFELLL